MILRKTIFVLALPLSLSLPAAAADGVSAPASFYMGSATKQDAVQEKDAASLAADRGAEASDNANGDCFYQQNASNPDCLKSPQAKAGETSNAHDDY